MVIPCLPKKKEPSPPTNNRNSYMSSNDLSSAFDLTWRNYLPSASQFCCCGRGGNIQLDDDPVIEPAYYNDHTLYRGEALQNYLDNPRDWEFESVLSGGQNDHLPQFVTRNPFGTASSSSKKKSGKKSKKQKNKRSGDSRPVVMETDMEEDVVTGYDIYEEEEPEAYYNDDAEFLGDDQIANLAYNRHSSQVMDQYGEELYYQHVQGPIIQEMQAPPPSQPREFYAAKTMPNIHFEEEEQENYGDYEERIAPVTVKPQASIEAAQALLSERLDDLTEKLAFIKNNIIHIRPPASSTAKNDDDDDEFDRNTLKTIKRYNPEEEQQEQEQENSEEAVEADKNSSTSSSDDIDSITSEALNVYENTTATESPYHQQTPQRYSSNEQQLNFLPSLVDNTPPFVSNQHPFTYFTNEQQSNQDEDEEAATDTGLNVRNVLDLGRKWLGV